ncbi:hypothetical protein VISP3789_22453 [Vibrio splendidus ATCC 33789]|nr:hypothetical protein VISP3789_22453 [Vibrio splendidus ATCC 33789]
MPNYLHKPVNYKAPITNGGAIDASILSKETHSSHHLAQTKNTHTICMMWVFKTKD